MNAKERGELVRLGMLAADAMDRGGHPFVGIVRRLAQALDDAPPIDDARRCRCGAVLPSVERGRPPVYCSTRCRQAAHRAARRNRDEMRESPP